MPGPRRSPFSYSIIRVVPRVERGECVNVGVVLFCRGQDFLGVRVAVDEQRLAAVSPDLRPDTVRPHLDSLRRIAAGDPDAGPIAALPSSERFGWMVAPSSTIIQPSRVHTGLCVDPAGTLERLFGELVG